MKKNLNIKWISSLFVFNLLFLSTPTTFAAALTVYQKNNQCIHPGITYTPTESSFAIWSPDTSDVQLYLNGNTYQMTKENDCDGYTNLYTATVSKIDCNFMPYHFLINGISVRDPYGRMIDVSNTDNNIVLDTDNIQPDGGWTKDPSFNHPEDAVIYETNIRDFTFDSNSGITSDKKGKYAGMVQSGTTYTGTNTQTNQTMTISTGIDHIKELGATHVQLMPFNDYGTCTREDVKKDPSCYNWGYDPINYNVPEWRYSQYDSYDAQHYAERIKEIQNMVNAFHKAGIRVIMDVVYNHTYTNDVFKNITESYYLPYDLSGTPGHATLDASNPMISLMIEDSMVYWVKEFHVDGFRVDLMGIFNYQTVADWVRYLRQTFPDRNLLVYGEPWNGNSQTQDPQENQRIRLGTIARTELDDKLQYNPAHIGVFNSQFREAIKGDNDTSSGGGYIFNQPVDITSILQGSRGAIRTKLNRDPSKTIDEWDPQFAGDPEEDINYVSCHDNLTLWDKIYYAWAPTVGRQKDTDYLKRVDEFAIGIVLTSQGIPFIHSGSEMLRTKDDNPNSYNAGDKINDIQWSWKVQNYDVFDYYKKTIAMRKTHPAFRMTSWDYITDNVTTTTNPSGSTNVQESIINGATVGDTWKQVIVFYNSASNVTLPLPQGTWQVAMEQGKPYDPNNVRPVTGQIEVAGTAVTVLYQT